MTKEEAWKQYYESDPSLFDGGLDENDLAKIQQIFYDGYQECQKEHEWHYMKDKLPDHNGQFYVALKGQTETFILNYDYNEDDESKMVWLDDDDTNFDDEVYAWREKLKAPKESE